MNDIDELLCSESTIEPSPDFTRRVMAAVQHESCAPRPIPFPWRSVVIGAVVLLCAAVVAVWAASTSLPVGADVRTSAPMNALQRAMADVDPIVLTIVVCLGCVTFVTIHRARAIVEQAV